MARTDMYSSAAHIRDAFDELQRVWSDASQQWDDRVSRAFCDNHLEPLGPVVKQSLESINRMMHVINEMHREFDA